MSDFHLVKPIWVWCYLRTEKRSQDRGDVPILSVWPLAHTYAFLTEEEAKAHPEKVGWGKTHEYHLQKVYLQELFPGHIT